jgi:hypothetical protein
VNLLGAILYDPSTAANKATTAAAVMAVCDATNLALAITVPSHGKVFVRMRTVIDGAATYPQILLGVMNHTGGAVLGKVSPMAGVAGTALATTRMPVIAEFVMTGLSPGALTMDAAFGVEFGVAATAIRWGGPNNTVASDAWGAFCFEAWDPQPIPTATPGAANGLQICGSNAATTYATLTSTGAFSINGVSDVAQTGDSFARIGAAGASLTALGDTRIANLDAAVSSRMATYTQPTGFLAATFPSGTVANTTNITAGTIATVTTLTNLPSIPANWLTAAGIAASALNGKGDWLLSSSYTAPTNLTAAQIATGVWQDTTAGDFTTAASVGKSLMNGVALGTGLTINGYTGNTPQTGDGFARLGAPAGASVSADVAAIKSDTGTILTDVNTGAGAIYTRIGAPAGASIAADLAAVNAKTTNLPAAPAAVGDIPTANANADALLDRANGIEAGWTFRQSARIWNATLFGKADGLATVTVHYRDLADTKNRISATVDADGNRTALTLDAT